MSALSTLEHLNTTTYEWASDALLHTLNATEAERLTADTLPLYSFGSATDLSMSQYVAAICITRASELEAESVSLMETLSANTETLEILADIEAEMMETVYVEGTYYVKDFAVTVNGKTYQSWVEYLKQELDFQFTSQGYLCLPPPSYYDKGIIPDQYYVYLLEDEYQNLISLLESGMDSLNSLSQDVMLDLQALLDKRDQSYALLTGVLRLCGESTASIVNHF